MLQNTKIEPNRNYKRSIKKGYYAPGKYKLRQEQKRRAFESQAFEEKEKTAKEKIILSSPLFKCPLSNQNFKGPCPITPCNFNITKLKPTQSCCLILQNEGKQQFDKWDLQHYLNVSESKLYKLKEEGSRQAERVLLLNKILELVREKSQKIVVEKPQRISNFIKHSNLCLRELNTKLNDVVLIKNNKESIENFLKQSGHSYTLEQLLNTTNPLP